MQDSERWLDQVYHAKSREDLAQLYDDWAESYDEDMQLMGYVHPAVIAGLTSRYVADPTAAILDAGCGTGTVGNILSITGYSNLVGLDMSEGMLAKARARDVYARLEQGVLGEVLPFETASIAGIVSTGVFTTGHAPASAFDDLARVLKPGGHLMFTSGVSTWAEAGFGDKLKELCEAGLLMPVETTKVYHPMPYSKTESSFTTRAHIYQRLS